MCLSSYALSVATRYRHSLSLKAVTALTNEGLNTNTSGQRNLLRSKAARSAPLHGPVRANS